MVFSVGHDASDAGGDDRRAVSGEADFFALPGCSSRDAKKIGWLEAGGALVDVRE